MAFNVGYNTNRDNSLYSLYGLSESDPRILSQQLNFNQPTNPGLNSVGSFGSYTNNNNPSLFQKTLGNSNWLKGAGSIASGIGSLAGAYNAYQANQIAKDQLDFERKRVNYNIDAQSKNYNMRLKNIAANRALQFGDKAVADKYYNDNKLSGKL